MRWRKLHGRTALTIQCSTNLVIILFLVQLAKKIPMEDPNVVNGFRALYVLSNLVVMGIYFYCKLQIDKKNGTRRPTLEPQSKV